MICFGVLLLFPSIGNTASIGVNANSYNNLTTSQKSELTEKLRSSGLLKRGDSLSPQLGFAPSPKPDISKLPKESQKAQCTKQCNTASRNTRQNICETPGFKTIKDYCTDIVESIGNRCSANCLK
jgi:hypothetical protein